MDAISRPLPPPQPRRRWGRKILLGLVLAGGLVWIWSRYSGTWPIPPGPEPEEAANMVVMAGSFTQGTRLFHLLQKAAVPSAQSQGIVQALSTLMDPRSLNASDRYELRLRQDGVFNSFSVVRRLERFVVEAAGEAVDGATAPLTARKENIPLTRSEKTAAGKLSGSLWATMTSQGLDPVVIVELADIFAWNIDFLTETREGDLFSLAWEESRTPEGQLVGVTISGAVYEGKATGLHTATRFQGEYYDEKGGTLRKAFLHAPLNFRRISSGFSSRRFHPILRTWRPHHGTDYAAPTGTPVVSVGDGTVFYRGRKGGLGNVVKIRHNGTYSTYYGHLSRFAKGVSTGTRVKQGQLVGYVGSTGLSTGPHLHFEIIKNGSSVNFLTLKMPSMGSVPAALKSSFEKQRDRVLPSLQTAVNDLLKQP